ncbi:hypothetical protein RRG08_034797 [Elysia crispata]|uniref:Uncharacterized protein n=1 Tax=Elysia crispata TaxID=231223 RepID=A0AAE0YA90_9GAST|nr:hypothetical protein RRG08_034797 [Elysia crispata]
MDGRGSLASIKRQKEDPSSVTQLLRVCRTDYSGMTTLGREIRPDRGSLARSSRSCQALDQVMGVEQEYFAFRLTLDSGQSLECQTIRFGPSSGDPNVRRSDGKAVELITREIAS